MKWFRRNDSKEQKCFKDMQDGLTYNRKKIEVTNDPHKAHI